MRSLFQKPKSFDPRILLVEFILKLSLPEWGDSSLGKCLPFKYESLSLISRTHEKSWEWWCLLESPGCVGREKAWFLGLAGWSVSPTQWAPGQWEIDAKCLVYGTQRMIEALFGLHLHLYLHTHMPARVRTQIHSHTNTRNYEYRQRLS